MSTQTCDHDGYRVCQAGEDCAGFRDPADYQMSGRSRCDSIGCGFNPYRMGTKDFYGVGKTVDTSNVFTYVFFRQMTVSEC
jgi:cellulose 1,4-beta-cellobiosidase